MTDDNREPLSTADALYGGTTALVSSILPAIRDDVNRLTDAKGWTTEQRGEYVADIAHLISDTHVDRTQVQALHGVITQYSLKSASDAQVQEWNAESRRQLRERHGQAEAERRLGIAKAFLAERPALAKQLSETGVGSHPRIVEMLTDSPHMLRIKPLPRRAK